MDLDGPIGFFPGSQGNLKTEKYSNPFVSVPLTYLPQNMDGMCWWASHFLLRFGFYRTALQRIANYFITDLTIECEDTKAKEKYKEMLEQLNWKRTLAEVGLNLLAYGNVFASVNRGFKRFLICPKCKKTTNIEHIPDYKFDGKSGRFSHTCVNAKCKFNGVHEAVDKPLNDASKATIKIWPVREIKVRFEDTNGEAEYYWDIPQEYIKKVTKKDNKFYSKKTPKVVYDCIIQDRMLQMHPKNFIHLRVPQPSGIKSDGKSIPFCIYLFDDFFMLKVLQRFNEAICFEDIAPFRVISMADDMNPQANPLLMQNAAQWRAAVTRMIEEHRRDPGSYQIFPFPIKYEPLNGKGKELAPMEFIQQAIGNILNSLNIPQELYSMTLQTQAIGPALRLFENSWAFIVDIYNDLLNHWANVLGGIQGLPNAKVKLINITMADDMERKAMVGQLVAANVIAKSEVLGLFGLEFKEQLRKKQQEEEEQRDIQEQAAIKQNLRDMADAGMGGSQPGAPGQSDDNSPGGILQQAKEIAQKLFPLEPHERRAELQKIKAQNETLYSATKSALEELTSQSKSQGVQQARQQGQGQQGQQ